MKPLLLLGAIAMPVIAWLSISGVLGPDSRELTAPSITLLGAAGYAFSIWSLIFLLDLALAIGHLIQRAGRSRTVASLRTLIALGFGLTAGWMLMFAEQWFIASLLVIWSALACLLYAAVKLARSTYSPSKFWLILLPLSVHVGWLSLAAVLSTAQVIVAYELFPAAAMLPWTLVLWVVAAVLLLVANGRLGGNLGYVAAALWGLVAVHVEQRDSPLNGAEISAWIALGLAAVLVAQTAVLWLQTAWPGKTTLWQTVFLRHRQSS